MQFHLSARALVVTGADIGFRVEGTINDVPAGRLVVRGRNGQWIEPPTPPGTGVRPVTRTDAAGFRRIG
jgi:hypothetical protein